MCVSVCECVCVCVHVCVCAPVWVTVSNLSMMYLKDVLAAFSAHASVCVCVYVCVCKPVDVEGDGLLYTMEIMQKYLR